MQIELTKERYIALMKAVYLGAYVTDKAATKESSIEEITDVELYLWSFAKQFGMEEYTTDIDGKKLPNSKFFDGIATSINSFIDYSFWDQIIFRLTRRDIQTNYTEEQYNALPEEEQRNIWKETEDRYIKEFEANDLNNLTIK